MLWSKEQIAQRLAHSVGEPTPTKVLVAVVQHVAALAERPKVSGTVVAGVVIEVRRPQRSQRICPATLHVTYEGYRRLTACRAYSSHLRVARMEALCKRHGVSLPAAALQFPLGHSIVASIIPGAIAAREVEQNCANFRHPILVDLWAELKHEKLIRADAPVPA